VDPVTTPVADPAAATDAAADTPVMSLDDVVKQFGDVVAVDHVSFDVGHHEFFSLLGPSGCGKTTTLRMLAGFERPTQGRILLEGKDASKVPPFKRNTNLVFQNYALFPHMTVSENVAFGPQRKNMGKQETKDRVNEVLDAVRLQTLARRYPRELSGGQQQRVALARALANRPALLLLDEPLGALDLKLREDMQFELKRIQREVGISFVYVTHDQGEAMTMSDRIAVMNGGRVEQLGAPETIYQRPATLFRLNDGSRMGASAPDERCSEGAEATLMIRPEHLRLRDAAPQDGTGAFQVRLVEETFQGAVDRYSTQTTDGRKVVVIVPADSRSGVISRDEPVWVSCAANRAYVLPEDAHLAPDTEDLI
jgi:spermidine/putrescine transport system ATP-binding protein